MLRPDVRFLELGVVVAALGGAFVGFGFVAQTGWAEETWPFATSRLTNYFLGSILLAIAVPAAWVTATRRWAALRASALFPFITFAMMGIYLLARELSGDRSGLVPYAAGTATVAGLALALQIGGGRFLLQDRDRRAVPLLVRGSFGVFAMVLIGAGMLLVFGVDNILPWRVTDETGVMVGLTFLGAASSYVYGFIRPVWGYVYAPLLGFLAYDLVLLPPLLDQFSDVVPDQRTSLVIYVAVLVYSATLAAYYLLVHPSSRLFTRG